MKIHIVQKGDSLWKIAKKYGVNFDLIKKVNSQLSNPDMLMPGMKIKVPDEKAPAKPKKETKVNFGTVKEAPISKPGPPPVQEKGKPKEMPVMPKPAQVKKEMPIQPMEKKKEMPKMPYVAPIASVQPAMPEIDINNYYMMNMAKMDVGVPAPPPIVKEKPKPKPKPKEAPKVKEKPVAMPKPLPKPQPMPMPLPEPMPCVVQDYCPPMIPCYDPCYQPYMMMPYTSYPYYQQPAYMPYYQQAPMTTGYYMDESSSFHYGMESSSSHYMHGMHPQAGHMQMPVTYQMGNPAQQAMPMYGMQPGVMPYGQQQYSPHQAGFDIESSHMYGKESSSHYMGHGQMMQQAAYDGYAPQCGFTGNMPMAQAGQYYQPMAQAGQQQAYYQPMTQLATQQQTQNPYYQPATYQPVFGGGQSYREAPDSSEQNASMSQIEPAAFDMPNTQDESSENEGQS